MADFKRADDIRLGDLPMADITEDALEDFLANLRNAGREASTRNHFVQVIRQAFRSAARKGYIARSPVSDESTLKREKGA